MNSGGLEEEEAKGGLARPGRSHNGGGRRDGGWSLSPIMLSSEQLGTVLQVRGSLQSAGDTLPLEGTSEDRQGGRSVGFWRNQALAGHTSGCQAGGFPLGGKGREIKP